jgi:hypothetical protein
MGTRRLDRIVGTQLIAASRRSLLGSLFIGATTAGFAGTRRTEAQSKRSFSISLANGTDILWLRTRLQVEAGEFEGGEAGGPPEIIFPGLGVRWRNVEGDFDFDVAGRVEYEGDQGEGTLIIEWSNPFIDDPSFSLETLDEVDHAVELDGADDFDHDQVEAMVVLTQVTWV